MALTLIFDADDTLWENNVLFERVSEDFFAWLAHPDDAHARAVRAEIETANIALHGYGSAVFLRSLHDCVTHLRGRPATDAERAEVAALATALLQHELELVPGVADVLAELGTRHELRLMTKGDPVEQQRKIEVSGLAGHFRSTHVVARKDVATYRALAGELALDPSTTWMIGNSPRSDILPARAAGLNAVFVPHPYTWAHEEAEIDDPAVLTVDSLHDLPVHF
ncbi:HAD family hydrolase [Pseudonocardia abyssalis]|uniref:HAD family hydrolase n=1 Tax=Pseudonocardia abyssalis TaxID=2792008 RepID=A0ABS6UMR3_9PSEU|nr:HAD family hydrolase [Pseudonocardia abyssalis]MBW0116299.1 HAD family hydrolase [Pseudonocardia abyssalis]MBW0133536.1 HAD family hydrolase [Pseudonocardia abyssalis]